MGCKEGATGAQGGRLRRGWAKGSEGFDLSNDSDCHSYCHKSVAQSNEYKWILKETLFTKEIVFWPSKCQGNWTKYVKQAQKITVGTTEVDLQTARQEIPKT